MGPSPHLLAKAEKVLDEVKSKEAEAAWLGEEEKPAEEEKVEGGEGEDHEERAWITARMTCIFHMPVSPILGHGGTITFDSSLREGRF